MAIACIIDDDPIQSLLVERMLHKHKLCKRLYVFRNGCEAFNHLKTIADDPKLFPDVIFLDINMPVMDGWGFLDKFKDIRPRIKKNIIISILSSSIWKDDITRAHSYSEVSDYLLKPVSISDLSKTMAEVEFLLDSE